MRITEKDLYDKDGMLDLVCEPRPKAKTWAHEERKCIFVKPLNAYMPLTYLINFYLKHHEQKDIK